MRLINITSNNKTRIKEMITTLIPMVGYVRITRHGLVVMKRHRWAFEREILNITDVCISLIPKKISELISDHDEKVMYSLEFNKNIQNIIYMKSYVDSFDIVDYIWRKYNEIFVITSTVQEPGVKQITTLNQLMPEIHSLSSKSRLFNVLRDIKRSKESAVKSEKNKLLTKIHRIKNLPKKKNLKWDPETIIRHLFYARVDYGY